MYHLLKGLHAHLTRKDEYSVVLIGLDNAGKTTLLEKIKTLYNPIPGMAPEKIGPTVGQNIGKISLPSTSLRFFDLGGQRDIRSIWPKYYDECHAVAFVLDAVDQARLSETWEVFESVINSPRLLNLPLLLLANKQDVENSLTVEEIRESFDAWSRAKVHGGDDEDDGIIGGGGVLQTPSKKDIKGKGRALDTDDQSNIPPSPDPQKGEGWDHDNEERAQLRESGDDGQGNDDDDEQSRLVGNDGGAARDERVASLDVMGISALEGTGVREAVNWLYIRVQNARRIF